MARLAIPWVDKTIAILASIPFAVELYRRWLGGKVSFPRAVLGIQILVLTIVMVLRKPPVRITPNPWFWLLAFVTSYGFLAFPALAPPGAALAPAVVANGLAVLSVVILVYALLSLGTSISFVPSQRDIVTRGAYRLVRHPIYPGVFIALLVFIVHAYWLVNLEIAVTLIVLLMIRSVVEERFLRADATYAAYLRQVRWRWFPGIA